MLQEHWDPWEHREQPEHRDAPGAPGFVGAPGSLGALGTAGAPGCCRSTGIGWEQWDAAGAPGTAGAPGSLRAPGCSRSTGIPGSTGMLQEHRDGPGAAGCGLKAPPRGSRAELPGSGRRQSPGAPAGCGVPVRCVPPVPSLGVAAAAPGSAGRWGARGGTGPGLALRPPGTWSPAGDERGERGRRAASGKSLLLRAASCFSFPLAGKGV